MRVLALLCLMIMLVAAAPGNAQGQQQKPLVVFVEESDDLSMASVTDSGPNGLTRLATLFQNLGARTEWIRLRTPVPDDARVIVLVRPQRRIPDADLARIWQRVQGGASLLFAVDPDGYLGARTEDPGSGIDTLVTLDQGISLGAGILVEPWFTNRSFAQLFSTFSFGFADPVPNPVSDPVRQYDLPVALWGARPLKVEPFGENSAAWALVDAIPQYVETSTDLFPSDRDPGAPFQLDLDQDQLGQFNIAGMGENSAEGSRVAVLGDAEFVQNGYGLALSPDNGTPMFPANYIITQRLAAWLLGLSIDQYPPLPSGMTWIAIDGDSSDWPANVPITTDATDDQSILPLNIQQVRAFRNNDYLYMSVETVSPPDQAAQIDLKFDSTGGGQANTSVSMRSGHVTTQRNGQAPSAVPDAAMAVGNVIELRLPLRVTGAIPRLLSLCLSSSRNLAFTASPDCMQPPIQIAHVNQIDPAPLRFNFDPVLAVQANGQNRVNVRSTPTTNGQVITSVPYGTVFDAVGQSADGQWIQIENAAYLGWINRATLFAPGNLVSLPVTG